MPLFISSGGVKRVDWVPPIEAVGGVAQSGETSLLGFKEEIRAAQEGLKRKNSGSEEGKSNARSYGPSNPKRIQKPVLQAEQIMTSPAICLDPDAPLQKAHEIMQRHGFRHVPVVSEDQRLVGMVSDRDLLRLGMDFTAPVHLRMSQNVLTATRETSIREIAQSLLSHRINALPIVNPDLQVIGILTTTDILKALVRNAPLDLWA